MLSKVITFVITLSMTVSFGLAVKDPRYIPLATSVNGGGLKVLTELLKNEERKQLVPSKADKPE